MATVDQMLRTLARGQDNVPYWVLEKDYALSYLIWRTPNGIACCIPSFLSARPRSRSSMSCRHWCLGYGPKRIVRTDDSIGDVCVYVD